MFIEMKFQIQALVQTAFPVFMLPVTLVRIIIITVLLVLVALSASI